MDRKQQAALWAHLAVMRLQNGDFAGANRALDSADGMLFTENLPEVWRKRANARQQAEDDLRRLTTVMEPAYY